MTRRRCAAASQGRAWMTGVFLGMTWVLVVGVGAEASDSIAGTDFSYLGAFRLECAGDWCSYNLTDLAMAPTGGLWVTDHVYDFAVRRIDIPDPPLVSTVFDDLPEASTAEGPLVTTGCPGDYTDLSGVAAIGAEAATTCRDWYNVTGDYTPVFRRRPAALLEEIGPQSDPFHPNKFGAYLFTLPADWVAANGLGSKTLVTGFSREAGANGGSQGPSLFAFDPDNPLDAVDLMYYRQIFPGCPGSCDFPGYESVDSWMGADWVRSGSDDAILVAGVKGGSTCYGTGAACGDTCRDSQGYHGYPYTGQILFYDPADLEARLSGLLEPYEVLPYATWVPLELWEQECPDLRGVAFDEVSGRLFLAEGLAGPDGQGIIHVYQFEGTGVIFADGFESGDAGAWSS